MNNHSFSRLKFKATSTPKPCCMKRGANTDRKRVCQIRQSQSGVDRVVQAQEGGGSINGGSKIPPTNGTNLTAQGDDGNSDAQQEQIQAYLVEEGIKLQSLPKELQQAIASGIVGLKDVQQWLAVAGTPLIGWICKLWPGFRERVLGNPRFLLVLAIEEAIGCSAKFSAEVKTRGDKFNDELHFVVSDMILEVIGDFFLVWLLSPRRTWKAPPASGLAATIAKLPAHAFQRGEFTVGQRVGSYMYRSFQFFMVGVLSSVLGHSLTVYMVEQQRKAKGVGPSVGQLIGLGIFLGVEYHFQVQLGQWF
eukprot:TRINITY_DN3637_c0_g2_i5.p1 TRINITY_DN3637_c0_g2~~TRINITY_DN3637_c0_g2_i5.p1  ORF type:complete len:306 (+),score=31.03 TRINITY_DN3637_c0_g2_i5:16-933(+)